MLKVLVSFDISRSEYILVEFRAKSYDDIIRGLGRFANVGMRYAGKENIRGMADYFIRLGKTASICSNVVNIRDYDYYYYFTYDYDGEVYRYGEKS